MKLLLAFASLITLSTAHNIAMACSCMEPGAIEDDFAQYEYVFTAEVIKKVTTVSQKNRFETDTVYTVRPIKVYKGEMGQEVTVTSGDPAMCGYGMEIGETHLLWIDVFSQLQQQQQLTVTNCSRSRLSEVAAEDIDWLEKNAKK